MRTKAEIEEAIREMEYDIASMDRKGKAMLRHKIDSLNWVLENEELY